jgi:hypothetical protein
MTNYPIPARINQIPTWVYEKGAANEEVIAQDFISMAYWSTIDKRAEIQALKAIKKLDEWQIILPLNKQSQDVQSKYTELVKKATADIAAKVGANDYTRARAMAESIDLSFEKAGELGDVMEQVQTRIALMLKDMGLLSFLEYDNITEYLLSKRSPWDGEGYPPGNHYEIAFMIDSLIPLLEVNGFPRKMILSIAENFHKTKLAIPYLRKVLSDVIEKANEIRAAYDEATDDEERKYLEEALDEALKLDPRLKKLLETLILELSLSGKQGGLGQKKFQEKMREISNNTQAPDKMLGFVYNTKDGAVMMISVSNVRTLNILQQLTNKFVDWHLGVPQDLAREAVQRLLISTQPDDVKKILEGKDNGK